MIQQTIQTIATGVFVLFASPIAAAITPAWWYGLGSILSGVSFFMAVLFVPETKYHRPASSYQEGTPDSGSEGDADGKPSNAFEVCTEKPPLDYANHEARTFRSDLRLIISKPEWRKGLDTLIVSFDPGLLDDFHVTNICLAIFPAAPLP
jgi:hypothetical protein